MIWKYGVKYNIIPFAKGGTQKGFSLAVHKVYEGHAVWLSSLVLPKTLSNFAVTGRQRCPLYAGGCNNADRSGSDRSYINLRYAVLGQRCHRFQYRRAKKVIK